jgi:chromosome segregation ATPase
VQRLLAERRELMVAAERARLEAEDLRRRAGRHDPEVRRLEADVVRLKQLLEQARAERDQLRQGIQDAVDQLRHG